MWEAVEDKTNKARMVEIEGEGIEKEKDVKRMEERV